MKTRKQIARLAVSLAGYSAALYLLVWRHLTVEFDDGLHNVEDWVLANASEAIVFGQPWNRNYTRNLPIIRLSLWGEIYEHIKENYKP